MQNKCVKNMLQKKSCRVSKKPTSKKQNKTKLHFPPKQIQNDGNVNSQAKRQYVAKDP